MGSVTTTLKPKNGFMLRETGYGKRRTVKAVFKDYKLAFTDAAGTIAYAALKLCSLPEGLIDFSAAVVNVQAKVDGGDGSTTGIFNAFDGDISMGTAAAAGDASLSSTEADLIASTATTQAVAGVTQLTAKTGTRIGLLDGTGTAKDVYFNMLVDDSDHNVAGASGSGLILNGEIVFNFDHVGDV